MGQVYRATDTKLKRQVAIKILPPSVAADHDRLARFQREAEVLASLNHPNIAAIYGLENGGMTALVMELVEGDDLSQRIARGAIPLDEALPIAKQIAEALEAAHEQGIIHRDLKPANIKVRADGTVKVLDFGLAKALEPGDASGVSESPTITTPAMTQAGIILGTAAYMSPEQAKGRTADKRSDVWAFGCVLHGDFNESQGQFSPDGRWIAYVSDESGAPEVYVQSFPALAEKRQVSISGGTQPRWRRDGRELFYLAPDRKLMAVTVKAGAKGAGMYAEVPRTLFETALDSAALRQTYSVAADGQRFLLNSPVDTAAPPMTIVLNWPLLLKRQSQ